MTGIGMRAIDPHMSFDERRRERYVRRSVRRSRDEAREVALGGICIVGVVAVCWAVCWAVSLGHAIGAW